MCRKNSFFTLLYNKFVTNNFNHTNFLEFSDIVKVHPVFKDFVKKQHISQILNTHEFVFQGYAGIAEFALNSVEHLSYDELVNPILENKEIISFAQKSPRWNSVLLPKQF